MDASNHYEAAFQAYLQAHGLCYIAVDETKRSEYGGASLKSLDFIVYGEADHRLLVDVKGRRFPTGAEGRQRRVWECWSTEEDIVGLERWMEIFGPSYHGVLLFAYDVSPEVPLFADTIDLWTWHDRRYLFRAIHVEDYRLHMRVRSPKWKTVTVPQKVFRRLARPFRHFTSGAPTSTQQWTFV